MDSTVQPILPDGDLAELPDSHWGGGYEHRRPVRRKVGFVLTALMALVSASAAVVAAAPGF